jgi:RimJ/RimL family protein N-acetyltransferase
MSCDLEIHRSFDPDVIKAIMTNESIWKTCAEPGQKVDEYEAEVEADCWLVLTNGESVIGAYNIHPHNSVTLEIHAHVLPEFRAEYSARSGDLALKWILENAPDKYQKVIAQIPSLYQNVINFTMAHGFVLEGVNRLSSRRGGKLYDQVLLGITRPEIEDYLNE